MVPSPYSDQDGLAALLPPGAGKRVLVVGRPGLGALSSAELFGYGVTHSVLPGPECPTPGSAGQPSPARPAADPFVLPLPYADERFDVVVIQGVLEHMGGARGASAAAAEALSEVHRVMKQRGLLLLLAENAFSVERAAIAARRWRRGHADLTAASSVPRVSALAARRADAPRSLRGWRALLDRSGFQLSDVLSIWPLLGDWRQLRPLGAAQPRPGRSPGNAVVNWVARGLSRLNRGHWIAPGYVFVSRPRIGDAQDRPLEAIASRIVRAEGGVWARTTLVNLPGSRSVAFVAGDRFVKLPVTGSAQRGIAAQLAVFDRLEGSPVAALLPAPMLPRSLDGIPYFTFPALRSRRLPTNAEVEGVLSLLAASAGPTPLTDTDLWQRIRQDREPLVALGAATVLERVEALADELIVTAGSSHGDLHINNMMCDRRLILVDWENYEGRSPHFIDILAATISVLRKQKSLGAGDQNIAALRLIVSGELRHPLLTYFEAYRRELPIAAAVTLYLLNQTSWLHRKRAEISAETTTVLRHRFDFCRMLFDRWA